MKPRFFKIGGLSQYFRGEWRSRVLVLELSALPPDRRLAKTAIAAGGPCLPQPGGPVLTNVNVKLKTRDCRDPVQAEDCMLLTTETVGASVRDSGWRANHDPEPTIGNRWSSSAGWVRLSNRHSITRQRRVRRDPVVIANRPRVHAADCALY